jgi:methylmalonyl-CoA mutase
MADNPTPCAEPAPAQDLFSGFTAPSYQEWYDEAAASLKGAPFDKRVITKTYEGIDIQPLYTLEGAQNLPHIGTLPGFAPFVRGARAQGYLAAPWLIAQELPLPLPKDVAEALAHDIPRGQTAANLVLDEAARALLDPSGADAALVGKGGMSVATAKDFDTALAPADLDKLPVFLNAGAAALPAAALLAASAKSRGKSLLGCVGADPLGALAKDGKLPLPLAAAYNSMAALAAWAGENAPGLQTVWVNASVWHDAGALAVQELAYALATGVEYMRALADRGLGVNTAAGHIRFAFSSGRNFYMEIAKFRAARILWCQAVREFGGSAEAQKMRIHGRTSAWTKTIYDPYVNMLRNTVEAFAAAMGGVESLHVAHFDEAARLPGEFSRRVSRNVQIVLQEECHFTQPVDPSGGSFTVETLTDQLAQAAWKLFQAIEAEGGMAQAILKGLPQAAVADVAKKKAAGFAARRDVIVGVNMYPNMLEKRLEPIPLDHAALKAERSAMVAAGKAADKVAAVANASGAAKAAAAVEAALAGATLGELAKALGAAGAGETAQPVRTHRGAEPYEKLRDAMEAGLKKTGSRIKVFLANMGPIPQHKPRADFTTGFFQAGGFEVLQNNGHATPEEAADAAVASGAPIVVICSTDATYPGLAPRVAGLIKAKAPQAEIILAGMPASDELAAQYKEAGVADWIHIRANCLDMLTNFQKKHGGGHA